jgi:hypothetical protein
VVAAVCFGGALKDWPSGLNTAIRNNNFNLEISVAIVGGSCRMKTIKK